MRKLTTRELQVARLAAAGWPRRLIAAALSLQERTVNHHLLEACRKLRLKDASELSLDPERLMKQMRTAPPEEGQAARAS